MGTPSVRRTAAITAAVLAASAATTLVPHPAGASPRTTAPPNIIRDAGAEAAAPDAEGNQVTVPAWTPLKGAEFTAVAYGAPSFPTDSSPGPTNRGHNFFAGGPSGTTSGATQVDGLAHYAATIRSGRGHFTLSGWLGGYSSQGDHATLTVTWETAGGKALSHTSIGPVTAAQRTDVTGMLYRHATGTVPRTAARALVELHMVRDAGEYVDGYADSLRLTIAAAR